MPAPASPVHRATPAWVSSPLHRAITLALIDARKAAGMTQRDLAAKLAKPQSFVSKIEAVERSLSLIEFVEWCEAVNVEPETVLANVRSNGNLS
jgi:transcriptional regulator with XRE-family HTH domain